MICSCFPIKIMCIFLISPTYSTYPAGLIHLVLTYRIIFTEGTNYGDRETVFSTFLLVVHCHGQPFSSVFCSRTSRYQILMATEYHDYDLLGYDAVQFGTWIQSFCFCPKYGESRLLETLVPSP
jgi:hypothetical protein